MIPVMFKRILILLTGTLVVMFPAAGLCHGVEGAVAAAQGYLVSVSYDDGEPMGYAAVEINGPDAGPAFQTARTDRNGRIMFFPDQSGPWQVVVKDGMGHMVSLDLDAADIDEALLSASASHQAAAKGIGGIATGLSILFGATGFLYGWNMRRKNAGSVAAGIQD